MKKLFVLIVIASLFVSCKPVVQPEYGADCEEAELCFIVNDWLAKGGNEDNAYQCLYGVRSNSIHDYKREVLTIAASSNPDATYENIVKKVYFDVSIRNNKRYLAGVMRDFNINGQDTIITIKPFVEIDGVMNYIQAPINPNTNAPYWLTPLRMFWENDDLYVILVTGVNENGEDAHWSRDVRFYESVNLGSPRYIMTNLRNFDLLNIRKCGNRYCLVGNVLLNFQEQPAMQWDDEGFILLLHEMYKGVAYDVYVKDGDDFVVGWVQDSIRKNCAVIIENGAIRHYLPTYSENFSFSLAACCAQRGDDVWIGGCIDNSPAIWKNGELVSAKMSYPKRCIITDFCFCKNAIYTAAYYDDAPAMIHYPIGIKWTLNDDGVWCGQEIYSFKYEHSSIRFSAFDTPIYTYDFYSLYHSCFYRWHPFPQRFFPVKK